VQQKLGRVQNQCNNKHCHEHSSLWQDQHQFKKTENNMFCSSPCTLYFHEHHQAH
jgi:hypothetical protein